ncbi:MAG: hypothetical protein ACOVKS_00910 [Aquimonas sp.]
MFTYFTPLLRSACAALLLAALPAAAQVSLDASFDSDGRRTVSFDMDSAATDGARRIFPTTGGGYLVVGQASNSPGIALALTRLTAAGNVDINFGVNGKRTYALNVASVVDAVQDSQGRVIFSGTEAVSGGSDVLVARMLPNGDVDPSFGFLGLARINVLAQDEVLALAIGPQDEVLALVRARETSNLGWGAYAVGFDSNGQNSGFDSIVGVPEAASGAAAWSAGRNALLVGLSVSGTQACTIRLYSVSLQTHGGQLQLNSQSFTGVQLSGTSNGCTQVTVTSIAAVPGEGGALLTGHREEPDAAGSGRQRGLLWSFAENGDINASRSEAAAFPANDLRFRAVAMDADGRLLVAGDISNSAGPTSRFALYRYSSNGVPDTGFNGGSAFISASFPAAGGLDSPLATVRDLRLDGSRLLLAGRSRFAGASDDDFAIAAFTTPGALLFRNGFEP